MIPQQRRRERVCGAGEGPETLRYNPWLTLISVAL